MTAHAGPVLAVDDLGVGLPTGADRRFAVHRIGFEIAAGRTLCVVGASGSGKSVLALAIMGLLPPGLRSDEGSVRLHGESLTTASPQRRRQLRGRSIGMIFQEPMTALNPVMRCGAQIDEVLRTHTGWPAARRRAECLRMLAHVGLAEPERMASSYPHQLSGGQRQRIVIAIAVILKPALLICDEPTTALDVTTQQEVLALLRSLRAEAGMALLFITHDMGVVAEMADDVLVLDEGRAVEIGPRDEVLRRPRSTVTRRLLEAVPKRVPPPARPAATGAPLLRGNALHKAFPTLALQGVSLAVRRGETVGVIGESGSGKSTLARRLLRLIEADAGSVHWGDADVSRLAEARLRPMRQQVQGVSQDPGRSLDPRRTVGDSLIEGAVNFGATVPAARRLAGELAERIGLPPAALQRLPMHFSGGQRQRLAIVRALACAPSVLVADEAVSALDVGVQAQVLELLREVQQQSGLGLLFITHDLRVAAQRCDRLIVMQRGRVVEEGPTGDVFARPAHAYTRQLLAAAPRGLPLDDL